MPAPSSTALAAPGPNLLADAFLALAGDGPPQPLQRSLTRFAAALAAVVVLALAAPLGWLAQPAKPADPPAATLGASSKAAPAEDDEDDGPG
jgi:hypothetical protein